MKLAQVQRGTNRALLMDLFNGSPPYGDDEQRANRYDTNVNFLEGPVLLQQARAQWENAFLKTPVFFTPTIDCGPMHKRKAWSISATKRVNRILKDSLPYLEVLRSTGASLFLFGIGPSAWEDRQKVVPYALGVEDVLLPSRSLLTMENVEYLAFWRQYSPARLWKLTHGPKVDPGWNVPLAESIVADLNKQVTNRYPDYIGGAELWTPEKLSEAMKEDGGFWASDALPTVGCWDFFFYDDAKGKAGWRRRIILDFPERSRDSEAPFKNDFLYDSGNRLYADNLKQIVHFQFGDVSAVAPFRFHSVRSLGYLLYAVCHLQNRLRCRLNDHIFTQLLQLFRVTSPEDFARVVQLDLQNKGIIPQSVQMVTAAERYSIAPNLVEMLLQQNRQTMAESATAYRQGPDYGKSNDRETATEVMAKLNTATQLVSTILGRALNYQMFQYQEIFRRLFMKNSRDPMARQFRLGCLQDGIPEEYLDCSMWNIEVEQVQGGGNKLLQLTQAKELMGVRNLFDPEPQREILRDFAMILTDDPAKAARLVPEEPVKVSDSVHDAEMCMGTLMQGFPVSIKTGMNHIEYVETLLKDMVAVVLLAKQRGPKPEEISGLQNVAQHVQQHIEIIAQDKNEKQRVKQYGDALGQIMNEVKGMAQRLMESQQQVGQGQPQMDPKDMAKVQAMMLQAKTKAQLAQMSHAARTSQKHASWELEERRKNEAHQLEMQRKMQETSVDAQAKDLQTAAEIRRGGLTSLAE